MADLTDGNSVTARHAAQSAPPVSAPSAPVQVEATAEDEAVPRPKLAAQPGPQSQPRAGSPAGVSEAGQAVPPHGSVETAAAGDQELSPTELAAEYLPPSWTAAADGVGPDDDTIPLPVILAEPPAGMAEPAGSAEAGGGFGQVAASAAADADPPVLADPAASGAAPDAGIYRSEAAPSGAGAVGARMRGPFEPVERSGSTPGGQDAAADEGTVSAAAEKLNQIKDLYLTAEAIGDDALGRHFDVVSERQRQLIREYFDQMVAARSTKADDEPSA